MYRTNLPAAITFTNCIRKAEATAENLWAADLTRDMSSGIAPGPSLRGQREQVAHAIAEKKKQKEGRGSKGKGSGKGAKGGVGPARGTKAKKLRAGGKVTKPRVDV